MGLKLGIEPVRFNRFQTFKTEPNRISFWFSNRLTQFFFRFGFLSFFLFFYLIGFPAFFITPSVSNPSFA